jgi:zinc protease
MKNYLLLTVCCFQAALLWAQPTAPKYPEIDIPYKKFVLSNGLRLLVHEDHKAPIAAFNIWYHVGSKNEKPGKTGFAHLFEHLMFNGSEHFNDDYFKVMDAIGATDLNGTTNNDRTNYFEDFPVSAMDKVLWIESDRMGFLTGVIDSARLNEQRGVVQNEKRQGENQPYALADELTVKSTYPTAHPYSWTVIGSMADLDAASIPDVKEWFKTYYGPNNAVVVIAGDVNADSVFEKVKKYFGDIPATPPIAHQTAWVAKMTGEQEQVAQDRVPQGRLQETWNVPGWGTKDITCLDLAGKVLAGGKTSRLYKILVYDKQLASSVSYYTDDKEIAGQFVIVTDAKPGVSLDTLHAIIKEELHKFFAGGPTSEELERAKTDYFSGFIKGLERIGGFGGKSDILATNETYGGDASHYKVVNSWIRAATPEEIRKTAVAWLSDGEYALKIVPYGDYKTIASTLDRNVQPPLGPAPAVKFPEVKQFALSNGLKVYLVERKAVPVVNLSLVVNAGYASDQFGLPGQASVAMKMLREGTATRSSQQISDQLEDLGATLRSSSDLDNSTLALSALRSNLDPSLDLLTDVLLNPVFPQQDFERLQKQQLLQIKQEQVQPVGMGLRILPKILYGSGHAYSNSFTGSGTEASIGKLTREDLVRFHKTWMVPNNAFLVVVGDIDAATLKTALDKKWAGWKAGTVPAKNIGRVKLAASPSVYILDKPGASQSVIFAAELGEPGGDPDFKKIEIMNRILGGDFTSRINMNLREDKHWSYGSFSLNLPAKGQGIFTGYANVQTDKTKESMVELLKELKDITGSRPVTEAEFKKVQGSAVLEMPGSWETNAAVLQDLRDDIVYDRGMAYLNGYADMIRHMTLADVQKAAVKVVMPEHLTWVIVGDRAKIEQGIRDLKLGPVEIIDSEGNKVK